MESLNSFMFHLLFVYAYSIIDRIVQAFPKNCYKLDFMHFFHSFSVGMGRPKVAEILVGARFHFSPQY